MKRPLLVLVVIVLVVFALGLYMGWFHVASNSADGKSNITLTVDKDKIQQDKARAVNRVEDMTHRSKDAVTATTRAAEDEAVPPPVPQNPK